MATRRRQTFKKTTQEKEEQTSPTKTRHRSGGLGDIETIGKHSDLEEISPSTIRQNTTQENPR